MAESNDTKPKRTGVFGKSNEKFEFHISTHLAHESRGPNAKTRAEEKKVETERRNKATDGEPLSASSTGGSKKPRPVTAENGSAASTTPRAEPLEPEPGGNAASNEAVPALRASDGATIAAPR